MKAFRFVDVSVEVVCFARDKRKKKPVRASEKNKKISFIDRYTA